MLDLTSSLSLLITDMENTFYIPSSALSDLLPIGHGASHYYTALQHTHIHMHTYRHIYAHIHTYYIHMHTYRHIYTHTHILYTHAYIHTYTCTHIHTYYIHMHIYRRVIPGKFDPPTSVMFSYWSTTSHIFCAIQNTQKSLNSCIPQVIRFIKYNPPNN